MMRRPTCAVQVRVRLDYSDVSRSDPDPDAEASARQPLEQPDDVTAATTSIGTCHVEPDGAARVSVTCDLGDLAVRSDARVSIEFVSDDGTGSIDLVIAAMRSGYPIDWRLRRGLGSSTAQAHTEPLTTTTWEAQPGS